MACIYNIPILQTPYTDTRVHVSVCGVRMHTGYALVTEGHQMSCSVTLHTIPTERFPL